MSSVYVSVLFNLVLRLINIYTANKPGYAICMNSNKHAVETLLEKFDLSKVVIEDRADSLPVTFWIPTDLKEKYDDIQSASRGKFHKFLKELLKKQIDSVTISD